MLASGNGGLRAVRAAPRRLPGWRLHGAPATDAVRIAPGRHLVRMFGDEPVRVGHGEPGNEPRPVELGGHGLRRGRWTRWAAEPVRGQVAHRGVEMTHVSVSAAVRCARSDEGHSDRRVGPRFDLWPCCRSGWSAWTRMGWCGSGARVLGLWGGRRSLLCSRQVTQMAAASALRGGGPPPWPTTDTVRHRPLRRSEGGPDAPPRRDDARPHNVAAHVQLARVTKRSPACRASAYQAIWAGEPVPQRRGAGAARCHPERGPHRRLDSDEGEETRPMTTYTVDAPPPGTWVSFADHFPHALTPEYTRLYHTTFEPAQASVYERYGLPFHGTATAIIDGHLYLGPKSLVGRAGARLPPRPVLWLATRLHPEMRRRRARARAVLRDRPWRDEVHVWRRELRPLWVAANLALQAIDPMSLDDGALAHYVRQCQANAEEGYRAHFLLHGPDLFATGLLLARGTDWGLDVRELLGLLVGSSPGSTRADEDLDLVRARVVEHTDRPETLRSLDDVRAVGPDVAAALDRFLLHHGWRLITSYDLDGRCLHELPGLVLTLVTTPRPAPVDDVDVDPLRQRVPADDRVELDRLLDDARFTYGLRDDNGGITSAWTVGLLRRSMLEVGRRLADRGRLTAAAHAVEVDVDELLGLLAGGVGPAPADVAARAAARASASRAPMPARFGPELPGREVIAMFPAPLDLMVRSQLAIAEGYSHPTDDVLTGLGIGDTAVTSRACVAHDAADALARMRPGDVLVARSTTPALNAALSIAGGLVVEEGGYLSHAAVTARELGLPAVIGASRALRAPPAGELVW